MTPNTLSNELDLCALDPVTGGGDDDGWGGDPDWAPGIYDRYLETSWDDDEDD